MRHFEGLTHYEIGHHLPPEESQRKTHINQAKTLLAHHSGVTYAQSLVQTMLVQSCMTNVG